MRSLFMLIALLCLAASSGTSASAAAVTGEQNLLLFYSNDVAGETEPCG